MDHDLGIPLQDDYFYDEPEEIIEKKSMPELEATEKKVKELAKKGELMRFFKKIFSRVKKPILKTNK